MPEEFRGLFACSEFHKVPLGTKDARAAEPLLAIANGEFEKKVATFREALRRQGSGRLSPQEARASVERYLNCCSGSGVASGATQAAFILIELDNAVEDLAGRPIPTAQSMPARDWAAYRGRLADPENDGELGTEAIAALEAEHALRHRTPGRAWLAFQSRVPRRS